MRLYGVNSAGLPTIDIQRKSDWFQRNVHARLSWACVLFQQVTTPTIDEGKHK